MDGVLVDFVRGSHQFHGLPYDPWPYPAGVWNFVNYLRMSENSFWSPLNYGFWESLPWTPDGKDILETVTDVGLPIALITTPTLHPECVGGKIAWVKREIPELYRKLIVTPVKEMCAHPEAILIDDNDSNVARWITQGGKGILIPRIWNAKHFLTDLDICEYIKTELNTLCEGHASGKEDNVHRTKIDRVGVT